MISLFSGTPGSGKSLHIAFRIYHLLKRGKLVIGNFPIDLSKIDKKNPDRLNYLFIDNKDLVPSRLVEVARKHFEKIGRVDKNGDIKVKEGDILLVIDEAQILYNSREWMTGYHRTEWLYFYSQHRKYGFDVVLIAQFDGMIDKQIRSLIEYNLIHRKASNFGIGGKFLSLLGGGHLFVAVKVWYPLNEKVGSEFFRSQKKYYSIYNTFKFFEKPKDKNENLKKEKKNPNLQLAGVSDPDDQDGNGEEKAG